MLIVTPIVAPTQIKHLHSSVSYQLAIYQNNIGLVMNRLVGMGIKVSCCILGINLVEKRNVSDCQIDLIN